MANPLIANLLNPMMSQAYNYASPMTYANNNFGYDAYGGQYGYGSPIYSPFMGYQPSPNDVLAANPILNHVLGGVGMNYSPESIYRGVTQYLENPQLFPSNKTLPAMIGEFAQAIWKSPAGGQTMLVNGKQSNLTATGMSNSLGSAWFNRGANPIDYNPVEPILTAVLEAINDFKLNYQNRVAPINSAKEQIQNQINELTEDSPNYQDQKTKFEQELAAIESQEKMMAAQVQQLQGMVEGIESVRQQNSNVMSRNIAIQDTLQKQSDEILADIDKKLSGPENG